MALGLVLAATAGCALMLAAAPSREARRQARVVLAASAIVAGVVTVVLGSVLALELARHRRHEAAIRRFLDAHVDALIAWKAERGAYPRELTELGLEVAPPRVEETWTYGTNAEASAFFFEIPALFLCYSSETGAWHRDS